MTCVAFAVALLLADVERAAVAYAPSVAAARAQVRERAALLAAAGGTAIPRAIASYVQAPQGGSVGTVTQRITTVGAQIVLGDLIGASPAIAQARADLLAAQADELAAERAERGKALNLYFDAIRAAEIRRLREQIVRSAIADRRAAELRFKSGDAPRLDVVRSDVALARAQADLAQAAAGERNARNALAVETAVPEQELRLPSLRTLDAMNDLAAQSEIRRALLDGYVRLALEDRPEIASARAVVAAQEAAVGVASRGLFPTLIAQVGYAAGVDSGINVAGPSAGVTLEVPLSHASADRVAAQRARLDQARAQLAQAQRAIELEVSAAVQNLLAQREVSVAASRARSEALAELHAIEVGYRSGASSSLDVDDARRTYARAAVDDVAARAALLQSWAALQLALGEGS